jgi:hypothetical protein
MTNRENAGPWRSVRHPPRGWLASWLSSTSPRFRAGKRTRIARRLAACAPASECVGKLDDGLPWQRQLRANHLLTPTERDAPCGARPSASSYLAL